MKLTRSNQEYLKAIFDLYDGSEIHVMDVASHMGVTKASVSKATDKLSEFGLLDKSKKNGIVMTQEGLVHANRLNIRQQAIFEFLVEVLGIRPSVAKEDACKMEHGMSEQSYNALRAYLKNVICKQANGS